jgi:hypothetical protein
MTFRGSRKLTAENIARAAKKPILPYFNTTHPQETRTSTRLTPKKMETM